MNSESLAPISLLTHISNGVYEISIQIYKKQLYIDISKMQWRFLLPNHKPVLPIVSCTCQMKTLSVQWLRSFIPLSLIPHLLHQQVWLLLPPTLYPESAHVSPLPSQPAYTEQPSALSCTHPAPLLVCPVLSPIISLAALHLALRWAFKTLSSDGTSGSPSSKGSALLFPLTEQSSDSHTAYSFHSSGSLTLAPPQRGLPSAHPI